MYVGGLCSFEFICWFGGLDLDLNPWFLHGKWDSFRQRGRNMVWAVAPKAQKKVICPNGSTARFHVWLFKTETNTPRPCGWQPLEMESLCSKKNQTKKRASRSMTRVKSSPPGNKSKSTGNLGGGGDLLLPRRSKKEEIIIIIIIIIITKNNNKLPATKGRPG